jgi:DNA polymerase IIIc chi subunit
MRYADIEMDSLLKLARAARELERNAHSAEFSSTDVLLQVAETFGQSRGLSLIETILDHEDRLSDFRERWKKWRGRRRAGRRRV